ncbi:MAG TPA: hypothetical protein VGO85_01455 [Caldimonas sp.]|jgi:hypothetical protein|nr:hypothetical protein [Caldimonas sp.]
MKDLFSPGRVRAASFALVALALASFANLASASRAGGAAPPAASAVQGAAQQPAQVQADESASLRQGTVAAVDERATRLQVNGVWLDLVEGKTQLVRDGRLAGLATLKAGEAIRFTVIPASGAAAPALKVIYAP